MPGAEDLIGSYLNRTAFTSDTEFGIEEIKRLENEYNRFKKERANLATAAGTNDISKFATASLKSIKQLIASVTELTTALKTIPRDVPAGVPVKTKPPKKGDDIDFSNVDLENLKLSTADYTAILEAAALKVNELTDAEKENLQALLQNYKASEILRAGTKETIKLIQEEIAARLRSEAALTEQAALTAKVKAEQAQLNKDLKLQANVDSAAPGSLGKAAAEILLYTNAKKKLNLETTEGLAANQEYNKLIKQSNDFILANADVETLRTKNIGKYNEAVKPIIDALTKEEIKLQSLTSSYVSLNRTVDQGRTVVMGFGGTLNETKTEQFTAEATEALVKVEQVEKQIEETRTRIEGFRKVAELPQATAKIGGKDPSKDVQTLTAALAELEKQGLGNEQVAIDLRTAIGGLTDQMYKAETASTSLTFVQKEIASINKELATTSKGTPAYDKLTAQLSALKGVSAGLGKNFANSKQELKALDEGAKRIADQFGLASIQYQKFSEIVGKRKNEIADVTASLKFQSSDTKGLDAALQGVQLLTGAYGAYNGIVALTGTENEDLQKSMQKLQAITALVASVQSIVNALQTESALVQGSLAAKTSILAAAQKIAAFFTASTATALTAETVAAEAATGAIAELGAVEAAAGAGSEVIAVTSAEAAAAMGAEAVAAEGLAVGLESTAVAEVAVAAGATTMATAIAATGIGALIILISVGIYKLVSAMKEWSAADASTQKANEALAGSVRDLTEATKALDQANRESTKERIDDLEKINQKEKERGKNAQEQLAMDKQIADARAAAAAEELRVSDVTEKSVYKKKIDALLADRGVIAAEELKNKLITDTQKKKSSTFEADLKLADENIKKFKEEAEAANSAYSREKEIIDAVKETKQQAALIDIKISKLTEDEHRKLVLETAKIESSIITSKNSFILSNDRSTLQQRLSAIRSNFEEQKKIIRAENEATQADPTVSAVDKTLAQKKANADIANAKREFRKTEYQELENDRVKQLQLEAEIQKQILDVIVNTNESILKNDALTQEERITALGKSVSARKAILDADFKQQLSTAGISDADIERIKKEGYIKITNKKITDTELLKLTATYEQQQVALVINSSEQRNSIVKDYYEKESDIRIKALKKIDKETNEKSEDRTDTYNNQLIELNTFLVKGTYDVEKYNQEKLKLDKQYAKDSIQIEIERVEKSLKAVSNAKDVQKQLQKELAALQNPVGPQTDQSTKERGDRAAVVQAELDKITEAVDKESELYRQLSKLKKELSDTDADNFLTNQEKIINGLEQIRDGAKVLMGAISDVMSAFSERRKQQLQDESDAIDIRTEKELAALEKSGLSEQKMADQKKIINERAAQQKEKLAEQERQINRRDAINKKAMTIFQIVLDTAAAIAAAKGNYIKIAFAAITGAAQLAVAIATPIPKFRYGKSKDNRFSGIGEVGHGQHEYIWKKGEGRIKKTPATPTLIPIEADDIIYPNFEVMQKALAFPGIEAAAVAGSGDSGSMEVLKGEMRASRNVLERIANKKELTLTADKSGLHSMWAHGSNEWKYIDEQTNWSK